MSSEVANTLDIESLTVVFDTEYGPQAAVRDVSLSIARGESYGLVGESGSGKTTLALAAIRYLADNGRVTQGRVKLQGSDLGLMSARDLRRVWGSRIGMVYQSPSSALNPSLTIGRQLEEVARVQAGAGRAEAQERVQEILRRVAMPDPESVVRRYPHQISGGMLQRCVIAMALITRPALLIMDEPTTALDVTTQAVVLDLIADLKRDFEASILYITHDLGVVARVCDRVGVMYAGELLEEAPLRDLFKRPLHPYTLNLLGCVPRFRLDRRRRSLATIPGFIPHLDELPPGCVFAPRCALVEEACVAARPPLAAAAPRHLTACRRWPVIPLPEESVQEGGTTDFQGRAPTPIILEARGLKQYFPAPAGRKHRRLVKAVDGVSVWLDEGRTLGVVGESGSGKTTMARAILGLEKPTAGNATLLGSDLPPLLSQRARPVLKDLQMIFQKPDMSLNPRLTIGETVGRPAKLLRGLGGSKLEAEVARLLEEVRLPASYARRLPADLSGGEKQRVAIARAFAASPRVVICDEPISSLDVSVQGALMNLLLDLQAAEGTSYLFISHDLAAVQHLSDRIAVMYLGRIVEGGEAHLVLNPPYHPYTEALLSAVPVAEPDVEQERIRLEGAVPSALDVPPGCRFHPRCPRKLGVVCEHEEPPERWVGDDHVIYCHIPIDDLRCLQNPALRMACGDTFSRGA